MVTEALALLFREVVGAILARQDLEIDTVRRAIAGAVNALDMAARPKGVAGHVPEHIAAKMLSGVAEIAALSATLAKQRAATLAAIYATPAQ